MKFLEKRILNPREVKIGNELTVNERMKERGLGKKRQG